MKEHVVICENAELCKAGTSELPPPMDAYAQPDDASLSLISWDCCWLHPRKSFEMDGRCKMSKYLEKEHIHVVRVEDELRDNH
jgi:hypothetical protein